MNPKNFSRSDRQLLASAWAEVARAPRARVGRSSTRSSAVFTARRAGFCARCGFDIRVGQDIRYHSDFTGVIHDGCRAPRVTVRTPKTASRQARTTGVAVARTPELCPECHEEHAGDCW